MLFCVSSFSTVIFANDWICSASSPFDEEVICKSELGEKKIKDFSQLGEKFSAEVTYDDGTLNLISKNKKIQGEGIFKLIDGTLKVEGEIKRLGFNGYGKSYRLSGKFEGDTYKGDFKDSRFHGEGEYYSPGFGKLVGSFEDDGPVRGVLFYESGHKYEGEFSKTLWETHGNGKTIFANGDVHIGYYVNGFKSGYGEYFYKNGDIAKGIYKDGQLNGPGEYNFASIDDCEEHCVVKRVGNMKDGQLSGFGTEYTETGQIAFQGEFFKGKLHGEAIAYDKTGFPFYIGEFNENSMTGRGKEFFENGSYYEGEFVNGVWNGNGTQFLSNTNERFVGNFVNGSLEGEGTIFHEDYRIEGFFEDSLLKGTGKTIYSDGKTYFAEYDEGKNN